MDRENQYSLRSLFLVVAGAAVILATSAAIWRWSQGFFVPPAPIEELEKIIVQAMPLVDTIDSFYTAYGRYPKHLEEAGVTAPWTGHGILSYDPYQELDDGYPDYELHAYLARHDTYLYYYNGKWCAMRSGRTFRRWSKVEARRLSARNRQSR
jgi:hypothetical protein